MAMPRKGSRPINVDGTAFRWRIRRRPTHRQGDGWSPLTVTVERPEEPGRVLVVSLPFARPDNPLGERTTAVRPVLVAGCIRRALDQGWNPGQPGSAFTLTITEDELTALLGEPPQYLIPFLWGMIPEGGGIEDLPRCTEIWSRDRQNTGRAPSDP
ncbi:hypothetical protein [Streptosporangium roseum]|uniref:Uncharacterized protein n=1 Tax=Streptosporangium roseum (strain ATCC 12428 / DSM 43021 / JCM 3005 / KCTC 9067 / NCIMB 10171 / NRRL 2505 / NI 9100) TaxID=479432 RepID=D2AS58_STRRD|nr:hypothetical protein [Streptosporangium roseum]ACZ86585.1 hypothetical protein Sros_3656 [Streptosporangium roseum DSM 43021]